MRSGGSEIGKGRRDMSGGGGREMRNKIEEWQRKIYE